MDPKPQVSHLRLEAESGDDLQGSPAVARLHAKMLEACLPALTIQETLGRTCKERAVNGKLWASRDVLNGAVSSSDCRPDLASQTAVTTQVSPFNRVCASALIRAAAKKSVRNAVALPNLPIF